MALVYLILCSQKVGLYSIEFDHRTRYLGFYKLIYVNQSFP